MGTSGNKQGGIKFMTLGSINNVTRGIWDTILMPDTVIDRCNALVLGQHNELEFLDLKKRPIG